RILAACLRSAADPDRAVRAERHRQLPAAHKEKRMSGATDDILIVRHLTKRYHGILAIDDLSLTGRQRELHAIIGPNGAGKTTVIKLLTGEVRPDGGDVLFAGRNLRRLGEAARSQIGLARSFQITSLFGDFTALGNVRLAIQAHSGHSFRLWRDAAT